MSYRDTPEDRLAAIIVSMKRLQRQRAELAAITVAAILLFCLYTWLSLIHPP